ncbi:MAG: tRNA 2-thiocytidine biosynthesis TtcA family protein [Halanaerobium sp.]|nr:tRNA 2-thiocytidine biosynthesis TtcA family protein [Halanaerobium sp.]
MELSLEKNYMRRIARAIIEFDMIQPEDRILIGFSGGKDSAFLVYVFAVLKEALPFPFEVEVVTIDLGYEGFPAGELNDFCRDVGLKHHLVPTRIKDMVQAKDPDNPCASCTYFRKGAINNFAEKYGFAKVALAHHYDDAVVTFLMSIIYSAQIKTFQPRQFLSRKEITIIRPLVYTREKSIIEFINKIGYAPIKSSCPFEKDTARARVEEVITELTRENKKVFYNLASAMREGTFMDLWPAEMSKEQIYEKQKLFWHNQLWD